MTKAEFGRRINTSRQNVSSLLKKNSFDTNFLRRVCEVLDYDFFQHLNYDEKRENAPVDRGPKVKLVIELNGEYQEKILEVVLGKEELEHLKNL